MNKRRAKQIVYKSGKVLTNRDVIVRGYDIVIFNKDGDAITHPVNLIKYIEFEE